MAVPGVDLSPDDLLRFTGSFVGARAGQAWVSGADAQVRDDGDEPYVLLSLSLAPPPAGSATWSTDDMFELRQEVRRRLAVSGVRDVVVSYVGGGDGDADEDQPPTGSAKGRPRAADPTG